MQGSSATVIRQVFSMRIREALVCPRCGTSSPEKPATYEADVFYAHVLALQEARAKAPTCPFDAALKVCRYYWTGLCFLERLARTSRMYILTDV